MFRISYYIKTYGSFVHKFYFVKFMFMCKQKCRHLYKTLFFVTIILNKLYQISVVYLY